MNLSSQRRLAAEILKVGGNRVWIDPARIEDVEAAITRDEIRRLIHEGAIKASPERGVSRVRTRLHHEKRRKGRRRGAGSRKGGKKARTPRKKTWIGRVRPLRLRLRELRNRRVIADSVYRRLYNMVKGGAFREVSDLEQYIKDHQLGRRR